MARSGYLALDSGWKTDEQRRSNWNTLMAHESCAGRCEAAGEAFVRSADGQGY